MDAFNILIAQKIVPSGGWSDKKAVPASERANIAIISVGNPANIALSKRQAGADFLKSKGVSPYSIDEVFLYISQNKK